MTEPVIRAVIYAAKSTADPHGSIPTQKEDCRTLAGDSWEVVAEFEDESASAFTGNRGPGLARAMAECERLAAAHSKAVLIVQHSDRLARGDGRRKGKDGRRVRHLLHYALWALDHDVELKSVQDPQTFGDLLYTAVTGQRNNEDSARKEASVRDGLRRRKERGQPVGPIPLGYTVDKERVNAPRERDPATVPVIERIFEMVASGHTTGQAARTLNADGGLTKRGKTWAARSVRDVIRSRSYLGENGYPVLIDADRWQQANDQLARLDPAAVQRRKGGRPADDSYLLRGVAFCRSCGAALYTRRQAVGRVYVCANRRQSTGLCSAPAIPAALIEAHVLRHLNTFVGSVEEWLLEHVQLQTAEQEDREAAVLGERQKLDRLAQQRTKLLAEYERMVVDGDDLARYALEPVARVDGELDSQRQRVAELEAVVSEWEGPADLDAALDFYSGLVDTVRGEVQQARGAVELRDKLHRVLSGLWAEVQDGRLLVDFALRTPEQLPNGRRLPLPIYEQRPGAPDVLDVQREQLALSAEFAGRAKPVDSH